MKKTMFMVALAAMSLASCSNDEVVEVQMDAINFNAVADNASRATTTNNISNFEVWGIVHQGTDHIMYFSDLELSRSTTGSQWVNENSGYFWPAGKMDFYAISPVDGAGATPNVTASAYASNTNTIAFQTPADQASQYDLLYALTTDEEKQVEDVPLNFRHALSQITYKIKVAVAEGKQKLKVTVRDITVNNIANESTLSFPKAATDATGNGYGEWATATGAVDYNVSITGGVVCDATEATADVTANYSDKADAASDEVAPLYLIPQGVTKADLTSGVASATGSYFTLDCKIEVLADDGTSWITLHDGNANVAAEIDWLQGYKYVYTFVFGGDNGGGKDDEGDDTIVPIKFSVTVDDFQTGTVSPDPLPMN